VKGMGRGGKRPGAGRKPNHLKPIAIRAVDMARLSVEELRTLQAIAQKLAAPAPDAHQNQIESNTRPETVGQ